MTLKWLKIPRLRTQAGCLQVCSPPLYQFIIIITLAINKFSLVYLVHFDLQRPLTYKILIVGAAMRSAKSDVDEPCTDEEDTTKGKLTFSAVSHATLAIVHARRRVRNHIKMMSSKQAQKASSSGVYNYLLFV